MKKILQHISKRNLLLFGMAFFSICAIVFYIFYCTKAHFHSDLAYWLLLADEQIKSGQFYPEGFHYTTGVPTISPQLFVLLIRLFCSDWLLSRELAVLVTITILLILVYIFYKNTLSGKQIYTATFLSIILLGLPMGHYLQTYYEAAYATQIIWDLSLMILIKKIFDNSMIKTAQKRRSPFVILFIVIIFNSMSSKNIIIFALPLLLAILVFSFIENQYHFERIFKNKTYNVILILSVLGILLGYSSYLLISKSVELDSTTGNVVFISAQDLAENFRALWVNIVDYYFAIKSGSLISISGITSCINFVVMVICTIIAPASMIIRFHKIENKFWKLYTLYSLFSNFFILYTMVFTNANNIRYYEPVFWHNIVFTCYWLIELIKNKDKYYEGFIYTSLAVVFLLGHLCYLKSIVLPIHNQKVLEQSEGTLVSFLEENNLDYGFATFWHSYKYMALSDGKITIAAYLGSPLTPHEWMTSDSYYDVNQHPGRCFILTASDETLEEKYYSTASETLQYKDYTILVYDKNIYLYPELK